jgi:hypothetical protein
MAQASQQFQATKQPARVFADLNYQTLDPWSRELGGVGKAEHVHKGANPRFAVTFFGIEQRATQVLYKEDYCARGEMENRIKEQQRHLFAHRTRAATMRANQIRLLFSSMAYVLLNGLRHLGLSGTGMAQAEYETIRLKLLKIGALVQGTARKVWGRLVSSCPYAEVFCRAHAKLTRLPHPVLEP